MGKVDDLRALRQQIRAMEAGASKPSTSVQRPGRKTDPAFEVVAQHVQEDLCGHTGVGGKRCIRAKDHPEKSHRYPKVAPSAASVQQQ